MKKKPEYTFEEGMAQVQKLVESLEQGSMPLNESFQAFETASEMLSALRKMLDDGDRRIAKLRESGETDITGEVEA